MRLGIRVQLLLALGSLLVLAFVPLFFAVASLTRATMTTAREASARALGRAIAGHVTAAGEGRSAEDLRSLLDAQLGPEGAIAIGVYDAAGARIAAAGEAGDLPAAVAPGSEQLATIQAARGGAVRVVVPGDRGGRAVAVVLRTDAGATQAAPLLRLVGLYTGIIALALLVFAYFSMTRLVVEPVSRLERAARRVADGARRLEAPRKGARELVELGSSLALMTERLRADEESLRAKIDEIERYAADLRSAQERLVRSERLASVGRLAAGLAHEIGNPLSAILGFQELLLAGGLDEAEQRDFLARMKRETERIHKILRDLLDFARPAASSADLQGEKEPAGSVDEAIADVLALVKPQKAMRGVEIAADVAPGIPQVTMSRPRLVQVILNLVLNAADAVGKKGGRIEVRAGIDPESRDRVRIEVEDDGPGIPEGIRDRLFEPFVTSKEVGQGTGLGLAVCRGLVESAGGTIAVVEEKGALGGARFVIEVPVQ